MVDIKEGINIGQSRCLGVAPGRTESEIICSFCNGLIAIYSLTNQRFVKNWKLSVTDNLTTAAVYSSKDKIYASVKNNNELLTWNHDTEWVSEFTIKKLHFEVHSLLATSAYTMIVYVNGSIGMEILNTDKLESTGKMMNVSKAISSSSGHIIIMYSLQYHYTLYQFINNVLIELKNDEIHTQGLGELVAMETLGGYLLTLWSNGILVRTDLVPSVSSLSFDFHLLDLSPSSYSIHSLSSINDDYFVLLASDGEFKLHSVKYGTLQCTSGYSQDTLSTQWLSCCHGYLFASHSNGITGYPLVVTSPLSLAMAAGKKEKEGSINYKWSEDNDPLTDKDVSSVRKMLKSGSHDWSHDVTILSQLTTIVGELLSEEVWPRKELLHIVEAGVFPANLISVLVERSLEENDWSLLVLLMRKVEVVPEQSLVDIIIAILSLGADSIKLSKKSSITKTELLSLALSLRNNHELLQQPLTQLSNNHLLFLLKFLKERLDIALLPTETTPTLSYSNALDWLGILIDIHFTHLLMELPHIQPLLFDIKKRLHFQATFLSQLKLLGEFGHIHGIVGKRKERKTWNIKVDKIDINL